MPLHLSRRSLGVWPLVAALCGGLALAPDRGAASGGQMQHPVIALSCPAPADADMCRALVQALAEAAPGRMVRVDPDPDDPDRPDGPDALAVILKITGKGAHHIVAHLEWRAAPGATAQAGPEVRMDVQDARLNATMYPRFMADLLKASRLPF